MCKISVVVPLYNAAKTLQRCIDSILAQSLSDFELVLINDGSTDNGEDICMAAAANDKRVRYIKKENGGLSSVRNMGIEVAKGDYLAFVDSDDYIDSDALEFMYSKAVETDADIILCGYKIESGKTIIDNYCREMQIDSSNMNENMIELKAKNLIDSSWNKLYKRSFVVDSGVRMPVGEIYEDTAFNLDLLAFQPKIHVYSECFYHYVQNMGSITKKYDPRKLPTIKKRALLLKEVTDGMDEYCDFYYIKSVFSSIMDMFLSCSKDEIIKTIDSEISEENFKKAAGNAYYAGRKNAVIIKVAKSGNTHKVYSFCHFCFFLKYKMRTLFMRVRD